MYWNINPYIFSLGPITIKWYTLLFALSFAFGYQLIRWIYRIEGKPVEEVDWLLVYITIGTLVGARLGHCLFYEPLYYFNNPIEILKIWKGGLASHGAAIGITIALFIFTRNKADQPFLWLSDRIVLPLALASCLIRLGNLFNTEIVGTSTTLPWAFVFERFDSLPRHPVQIYESITYGFIFILLIILYRKHYRKFQRGFLTGIFLSVLFSARFLLEFFKTHQASYGADMVISVGQYLCFPLIMAGIILLVRTNYLKLSLSTYSEQ